MGYWLTAHLDYLVLLDFRLQRIFFFFLPKLRPQVSKFMELSVHCSIVLLTAPIS